MHCEDKHKKSSNTAKTALGFGIAGTALGVINSGWLGGRSLFGRGREGYEGGYDGYGRGGCHPCPATCDDIICIEKEIGGLALALEKQIGCMALEEQGLTYRMALKNQKEVCDLSEKESCDVLNLYRYNDKKSFELYKSQRDGDDCLKDELCCLKAEVAAMKAIRPYQDKIIELAICDARKDAKFDLFHRTCKMISGEVVLPSTPLVTGFGSFNNCCTPATTTVGG